MLARRIPIIVIWPWLSIARKITLLAQHWLEPVSNTVSLLTSKRRPNDTESLGPPLIESNASQRVGSLIAMSRTREPNPQIAVDGGWR
jgi:hypothetical protein